MKKIFGHILCFTFIIIPTIFAQDKSEFNYFEEIIVNVSNPTNIECIDELVSISMNDLKVGKSNFNKKAFIVYSNDQEIPSQLYSGDSTCSIIFAADFQPNESKSFSIRYLLEGELTKVYPARTYAELAMKFDAVYKDKKFTRDHFQNFEKVIVPKIHTDHDALFKYEGPGWESEKVGYRFYLDWRNATDIFGKKVNELVLHKVGTNDVVANDDSYHEMQDWGMDIFKVGSTLGIGSIGMMNNEKIEMVSKTDEISCEITTNGPILSEIKTIYSGWLVDEIKHDLKSKISISAGSRLSKASLEINNNAKNITTGLAKYIDTEFIKSTNQGDWQYIALYGKQTLNNDDLGIVLFYRKSDLIKQGEDDLNYYVSLKPNKNMVEYAFAAAWEKELNGITTKEGFFSYINEELLKLNNPVIIDIK